MKTGLPAGFQLRSVFAIDEREQAIAFVQTIAGKILIVAAVLGLMLLPPVVKRLDAPVWSLLGVGVAAAHAYLPSLRGLILLLGAWLMAIFWLPDISHHDYVSLAVVFMACWLTILYARRFNTHVLTRRPVLSLLSCLGLLTAGATQLPPGLLQDGTWSFLVVFSGYIWFLSYAVVDVRGRHPSPDLIQMGVQQPFWLSSSMPIGKGAVFLLRHLSTTPRDLAITQLKALKLIVWMVVLVLIQSLIHRVFMGILGIPTQEQAITAYLDGNPYPNWVNWIAVTLDTVFFSLYIAIFGHQAVGVARLAGFRLPRNTCRPMQSRTLAEFWNRYNFYFKEVMVDFFYIPTFLKGSKKYPRLRMFIATFMAAGVGNFIFHFIRDLYEVRTRGFDMLAYSYLSYALYCALLATAIAVSQLRLHAGIKPQDTLLARVYSFIVVWGFIVLLQGFDTNMRVFSIVDNLRFTAYLFRLY